ncbi:hypothetical protein M5C72_03815 [Companilactobacillus allii]|uniref:Uncharacterized protein n=1 Tax=Companilactobacillus allii TaxID=1847728 RepID=A0A1P8Q367_9LACO|nr:hypothetical protein [Companilactobacillus allii]APX72276.1 hypothetical protein BTM29_06755 [Companilactobacillus allii]USQ69368.1 hypothetical protein M5C72_03815 [Companilactobacillus allii]
MNITLKLGTYSFLKPQQQSADTLLKPLFDTKTDHLLIKVLTRNGQYRNLTGTIDSRDELYLLTYLKFNADQSALFRSKFIDTGKIDYNSSVYQLRENLQEYLIISTFDTETNMQDGKKYIQREIDQGIRSDSKTPFGFFTKDYKIIN